MTLAAWPPLPLVNVSRSVHYIDRYSVITLLYRLLVTGFDHTNGNGRLAGLIFGAGLRSGPSRAGPAPRPSVARGGHLSPADQTGTVLDPDYPGPAEPSELNYTTPDQLKDPVQESGLSPGSCLVSRQTDRQTDCKVTADCLSV